jgi:formylglycine-generating enzyme required for sulfatase activity
MARPAWVARLAAVAFALAGAAACWQVLGVEDIPTRSPPADAMPEVAPGDTSVGCGDVTTRCAPSGLAFEQCGDGGVWSAPIACPGDAPVCLGAQCTCLPDDARCFGRQRQVCRPEVEGGVPTWVSAGAPCSGACALSGCVPLPPSCAAGGTSGISDCPTGTGDGGTESCCTSNEVPGGTFYISYDGFSPNYMTMEAEPTVSGFRLDRFEVTVGRFGSFVNALGTGWVPPAGSGKHFHLNAGEGLVNRAVEGGVVYESGWDPSWDSEVTAASVNAQLACGGSPYGTWGTGNDSLPVNCIPWTTAYAFCIWDGGFLPSDAEWNYAAAGGADQRIYPWSPSYMQQKARDGGPDETIDCTRANFVHGQQCSDGGPNAVGMESHRDGGDSKWLQADMAGNVFEWTLDTPSSYTTPWTCKDCAFLPTPSSSPMTYRLQRGGAFLSPYYVVYTSFVGDSPQSQATYAAGVRCARAP